jgi:hypothetical protein
MRSHLLRDFQLAAILQVRGDTRGAKTVAAYLGLNPGVLRLASREPSDSDPGQYVWCCSYRVASCVIHSNWPIHTTEIVSV